VIPRVVVVATSFPRDEGDPSGHFVQSHALALASAGASVHVVAPFGRAVDRPQARAGLTVYPAGGGALFGFPGALARARGNPLRLAGAPVFAAGVRLRLRQIAPFDRAVAHWIVPGAWPLLAGIDVPLEVVSHGADVRLLVRSPAPLRSAIVRGLLERGACFQFVAMHLLDTLARSLPLALADRLRTSSRVEPAPIELPDIGESSTRAGEALARAEPLALCVGRLVPEKRYHLVIGALAGLSPPVRLVMVGDGPERARLEALASSSGLRTTWTGALPRREALAWIAAADVLLHPSASEGAPTVVREARALGTAVIACAAGDLALWAKTDAGITIVAPNASAIREAVLRRH
jgi:teichuronic acid biosynthesis glycosyltransferase TuaC